MPRTISLRRLYEHSDDLTEAVLVRRGEQVIGTFIPTGADAGPYATTNTPGRVAVEPMEPLRVPQAASDAVLRRMNTKGGR